MDLFDALTTTRAVRRFTAEPVSEDEILQCIRVATQAPSGGNIQPWQFLVVTDPETKRALGDVYRRAYARYEPALLAARPPAGSAEDEEAFARMLRSSRHLAEHLGEAPAMVLVLMPNISMALRDAEGELGIGTPLTTVYRIYQDEVRALCGIPERYEIVALVPMGRPRGRFVVGRRRPAEQVTHWSRFGTKR